MIHRALPVTEPATGGLPRLPFELRWLLPTGREASARGYLTDLQRDQLLVELAEASGGQILPRLNQIVRAHFSTASGRYVLFSRLASTRPRGRATIALQLVVDIRQYEHTNGPRRVLQHPILTQGWPCHSGEGCTPFAIRIYDLNAESIRLGADIPLALGAALGVRLEVGDAPPVEPIAIVEEELPAAGLVPETTYQCRLEGLTASEQSRFKRYLFRELGAHVRRRRFARVPVDGVSGWAYRLSPFGTRLGGRFTLELLDLSGGGLRFQTTELLQPAERLEIGLRLDDGPPLGAVVTLADALPPPSEGKLIYRARFTTLAESDRRRIVLFVFRSLLASYQPPAR
ncbi:MAG: hypothetical protein KatS3mg061_1833 [Dehalococcoidia bacterium]|nr:MAG: hypothetical protein KatS3mg061_1833 [Dehalococcoidia bacterium]